MTRLALLCVFLPFLLAQPAQALPDDGKKQAKAVRKSVAKLLEGRSLKKLTRTEAGPRKQKRIVLRQRAASKLYWRYLPAFYREKFDPKTFLPLADEGRTSLVIHKPSITKVFVHRASVTVEYSAVSVALEKTFLPDHQASRRVKLGKKPFTSFDVWVRQGGKWVLSRQRFDGQKHSKQPGMVKEDRRAVTGETLRQHPWFASRVSANAMSTAFYETQAALHGPWPDDTEVARAKRRKDAVESLTNLLERKEVGDIGWVKTVRPPPKGTDPRTKLQVIIYCGYLEIYANIGEAQATKRQAFFESLKKGDPVVFRLPYRYTVKSGLIAQPRDDGIPTIDRLTD